MIQQTKQQSIYQPEEADFNFLTLNNLTTKRCIFASDLFIDPSEYTKTHSWEFEGVVFDFDQTIAKIHVWHHIAKSRAHYQRRENQATTTAAHLRVVTHCWSDTEIINLVFGGQTRAERLRKLFLGLKKRGHQLFVCSRGYYQVIVHLLTKLLACDATDIFTKIIANNPPDDKADCALPCGGKTMAIEQIMQNHLKSPSKSFIFIDDDLKGEVLRVASEFMPKLTNNTALIIYVHPPNKDTSGGMSFALMDEIEAHIKMPSIGSSCKHQTRLSSTAIIGCNKCYSCVTGGSKPCLNQHAKATRCHATTSSGKKCKRKSKTNNT
jgi:hypothetical protein